MKTEKILDPEMKKYAIKMPFTPFTLYLSQKLQRWMLRLVKTPGVKIQHRESEGVSLYLFEPENLPEKPPCLLYIHGGGFGYQASPHHKTLAAKLAKGAGCRVICPDYRLLPKHPYPAAREDVLSVYRWICENYPDTKIAIGGDSAGGALAAYVICDAEKAGLIAPCLQLLLYPVTDATMCTKSMQSGADTPLWCAKNNAIMWRMYLGGKKIEEASPMQMPLPKVVPDTYLETAELDCLHDEGIAYADRLRKHGVRVELHETYGTPHGYDIAQESVVVKQCMENRINALKRAFA